MTYWVYHHNTLIAICKTEAAAAQYCVEDGYWVETAKLPPNMTALDLSLQHSPAQTNTYFRYVSA